MNLFLKENKRMVQTFNSLILRITLISMYIALYKNIEIFTEDISKCDQAPFLLFQMLMRIEKTDVLKCSFCKTFSIIFLFVMILLPILSTLTAEISTDTIFFYFLFCQLIYCVDSVRSSILSQNNKIKEYKREQTIPLEESLLVIRSTKCNGTMSKIAAVIGFILLFSRLDKASQITYFQIVSFILYFFVPNFLERLKFHHDFKKMMALIASAVLFSFFMDLTVLVFYLLVLFLLFLFFILTIELSHPTLEITK